jgi:IS5 family transposase
VQQMLRIYFMQTGFNLSDPQADDSLYDIESMRRFAGIELLGHDIRRRMSRARAIRRCARRRRERTDIAA